MKKKHLLKLEIKQSIDIKYLIFFFVILLVSVGFPIYGFVNGLINSQDISGMPGSVKIGIINQLESYILNRFSLTIYIFTAWGFIPKLFFHSKLEGEVESLLAVGYSAKDIWTTKAKATLITSLMLAIPINLIFIFLIKYISSNVFGVMIASRVIPWIICLIINPIMLYLMVLLVGAGQLLADDVRKSSIAIFFIGILNMALMFLTKNDISDYNYLIVYGLITLILIIANIVISKFVTTENIILSKFRVKKSVRVS